MRRSSILRPGLVAAGTGILLGATALSGTALAAGTTSSTTAGAVPPAAAEKACSDHLPGQVLGAPAAFDGGDRGGDYLWHDSTGWHLRVTHRGDKPVVFAGTIRASSAISATGFRLEKGDAFSLSADKRSLSFRFVNYGHVDGIDFRDNCAVRTDFALQRDGHSLPPSDVYLGTHGSRPTAVPFGVERRG